MTDTEGVFSLFCATPLRLRKKRTASATSSPSTASDETLPSALFADLVPPCVGNDAFKTPPRIRKIPTPAEVERLKGRVEAECRIDGEPHREEPAPIKRRTTKARGKAEGEGEVAPVVVAVKQDKKHKRISRSVAMVNSNTGGIYVDTPTKAAVPPKRSRKTGPSVPAKKAVSDAAKTNPTQHVDINMLEAEKENIMMDEVIISRNIIFDDTDEELPQPDTLVRPTKPIKKALSRRPKASAPMSTKRSTAFANPVTHASQRESGDSKMLEADKEISRNVMDPYADIDEAFLESTTPKKSNKKAASRRQPKKTSQPTEKAMKTTKPVQPCTIKTRDDDDCNLLDAEKENMTIEAVSISRNIMDAFDDVDEAVPNPVMLEQPTVAKKKAVSLRKSTVGPKKTKRSLKSTPKLTKVPEANVMETSESRDIKMLETEKEAMATDEVPVSRDIMDAFTDLDEEEPDLVELEKPKKPKKKAAPRRQPVLGPKKTKRSSASVIKSVKSDPEPIRRSGRLRGKPEPTVVDEEMVVDEIHIFEESVDEEVDVPIASPRIDVGEVFCSPLLETKTTAGALFALWFNALGQEVEACSNDEVDTLAEVLHGFFAVCQSLCRCEAMARSRVEREVDSDGEETVTANKKTKSKKTVRFRHFDLSSIDLNYHFDKTVPDFVEGVVRHYVEAMDYITALCNRQQHPVQANMIAHIIGVLCDTDRLIERTKGKNVVSIAFRSMSGFEHDEVRACQPFYSDEFSKLVSNTSIPPTFLEVVFSSLISSLLRFRLRELFLPFDPKELGDGSKSMNIATYEHQDYGAAIHRALQEMYLYQELAASILNVVATTSNPRDNAIKKMILDHDVEDLVHVERYMLAARYLRLSLSTCILVDATEDEETVQLRERLEELCTLVKRFRFEDEAHLYPLASVEEFVRRLERQEASFKVLEKVLESVGLPHYHTEAPCVECNEIVIRAQQAEAITCCSCSGRFHLRCLHLPPSFAQFAGNYTCPSCYLGRTR